MSSPINQRQSLPSDWTRNLRLRSIKILLSLAETQNMTHTAAQLNMTQPGLSKWLKDFEEELGLPLFERHARGLRPTPYGRALLSHAQRIDKQIQRARGDMTALRQGKSGRLIIGTSGAASSHTVPDAVLNLLQQMPNIHIELTESTLDRLITQLSQGEVDVVVGRYAPELDAASLQREILYEDPICLVARVEHPLFGESQPQWADLMHYRWLIWPKGTQIRNAFEEALDATNQPHPIHTLVSNSITANLALLSESDMIAVVSRRAAQRIAQNRNLAILPISLAGFGSIAMYWRGEELLPQTVTMALHCLRTAHLPQLSSL